MFLLIHPFSRLPVVGMAAAKKPLPGSTAKQTKVTHQQKTKAQKTKQQSKLKQQKSRQKARELKAKQRAREQRAKQKAKEQRAKQQLKLKQQKARQKAKVQKAKQQQKAKLQKLKQQLKIKQQKAKQQQRLKQKKAQQQRKAKVQKTTLQKPKQQKRPTQATAKSTIAAKLPSSMSYADLLEEQRRNRIGCALTPTLPDIAAATGLNIPQWSMRNTKYDKGFCSEKCPHGSLHNDPHTHWKGQLGNRGYYCPWGWYRFSLNVDRVVGSDSSCAGWERWTTMYHGTTPAAINSILNPADPGKFKKNDGALGVAAYFSPSIRYIAYPAYSFVTTALEKGYLVYYQLALEVRVDTTRNHLRSRGASGAIDANYDSTSPLRVALMGSRSWVDYVNATDGVIVTGLMVRKLRVHPSELDECKWISQSAWTYYRTPKPISVPGS